MIRIAFHYGRDPDPRPDLNHQRRRDTAGRWIEQPAPTVTSTSVELIELDRSMTDQR